VAHFGDALLVVLRAANQEAGEAREDLVSLRMLATPGCLVTLRRARVRAVDEVRESARTRPADFRAPADLIAEMTAGVQDRLRELIEELAERLDDFEDRIADPADSPERAEIAGLRRGLIALRKSLVPQRDALARLAAEPHAQLARKHEKLLREEAQRAARLVDEVESARERAAVLMEEIAVESTERLNRRIYYFTVIAGIFLPLTFLAGALGMNVGGVPFAAHPRGFAIVLGALGLLGVGIWLLLRRKRWV
jgi:zinc transporter